MAKKNSVFLRFQNFEHYLSFYITTMLFLLTLFTQGRFTEHACCFSAMPCCTLTVTHIHTWELLSATTVYTAGHSSNHNSGDSSSFSPWQVAIWTSNLTITSLLSLTHEWPVSFITEQRWAHLPACCVLRMSTKPLWKMDNERQGSRMNDHRFVLSSPTTTRTNNVFLMWFGWGKSPPSNPTPPRPSSLQCPPRSEQHTIYKVILIDQSWSMKRAWVVKRRGETRRQFTEQRGGWCLETEESWVHTAWL